MKDTEKLLWGAGFAPKGCGEGYEALAQFTLIQSYLDGAREDVPEGWERHMYIGNAFSLQMIPDDGIITKHPVSPEEIPTDAMSIIGHADTAAVVSNILNRDIPFNRASVTLEDGDVLYVAQVVGGRLPEGSTTLPDGIEIKFYKVLVTC